MKTLRLLVAIAFVSAFTFACKDNEKKEVEVEINEATEEVEQEMEEVEAEAEKVIDSIEVEAEELEDEIDDVE